MFTIGRIIFTIGFVIIFVIAMYFAYAKDKKHQKFYYKDVWRVGLAIILIIVLFAVLTFWLHD